MLITIAEGKGTYEFININSCSDSCPLLSEGDQFRELHRFQNPQCSNHLHKLI